MRVVGFTLMHGELESAYKEGHWDIKTMLRLLEEWLVRERRLVEVHTGLPLLRAYFVRIDPKDENRVVEVLAEAS
jgi:hypothetical protein